MKTPRLQRLYQLAIIAMAVGCLALGGTLFLTNFEEYQRYRVGARELARFHSILQTVSTISAERGPANSAMGAAFAERPPLVEALESTRARTDSAIASLEKQYRESNDRSAAGVSEIDDLRAQLARARKAVDAAIADPAIDGRVVSGAILQMFLAADLSAAIRDSLGQDIVRAYPQISTEIILATVCSNMREYAGRFGSYVVMMLTSSADEHNRLMRLLMETTGQLTELRHLISNYTLAFADYSPVDASLRELDRAYFSDALPFARRIAETAHSIADPLDAAAFTKLYVPGMISVENMRTMISEASITRLDDMRRTAGMMLVLSSALTLIICTVLVLINLALSRMLFRPLIAGKEQIVAIAKGNLSEPPAAGRVGREIREMFDSLKVLREHERYKRELERNQERMAEQLKRLSETDGLTGLLNRRALEMRAANMFKEAGDGDAALGVILFDIDHFKSINDTYGHRLGDRVLQSVGPTLQPLLDPQDTFARFGGEEFVVLLKDEGQRASLLAEQLREALANMAAEEKLDFDVTASFGVATGRRGNADWPTLISKADQRLYEAKRRGRNRVVAG